MTVASNTIAQDGDQDSKDLINIEERSLLLSRNARIQANSASIQVEIGAKCLCKSTASTLNSWKVVNCDNGF